MSGPAGVGLVGCGAISRAYLAGLAGSPLARIVACADLDPARAAAFAEQAGGGVAAMSVEELLASPEVDIVLNLTIPGAHTEVNLAALQAGKSAYVEKPLALDREEGARVIALAAERGLRVGSAPDTFLGAGLQRCRRLVDQGAIGEPVAAVAELLCAGHESWHPDPAFYYKRGGGPLYDMGPYYLSALVSMLGPVARVAASARTTHPKRTITSQPRAGEVIDVEVPTHVSSVLDFQGGPTASVTMSFDIRTPTATLVLHGTEGSLRCPDPNGFGGPVFLARGGAEWDEVPLEIPGAAAGRGFGLADMAAGIAEGRPHRASGELGFHVLDVMQACYEASDRGAAVQVASSCERPEAL